MGKVRLRDTDLASLIWDRLEGAELVLISLVVDMSHVVNISIFNLVLPSVVPGSDDLVLVESLNNNHAVSLRFVIK